MIKHPLFAQMSAEHEQILLYLAKLDNLSKRQEVSDFTKYLWNAIVENHHLKEERFLFNSIAKKPKIVEGGPMCSLYYDFHMMDKFKERVESITQKSLSIEPHQLDIIESKSPLAIPLEEHRGGKDLLAYIIKNQDQLDIETIKKYLNIFKSDLIKHVLKEENCLYHLCANLLTEEEADSIYKQWKSV